MDRAVPFSVAVIAGTALAVFCASCFATPEKVAAHFRERYLRGGRWTKMWLTSMVTKRWYPTYIRWTGLVGFIFTVIWLVLVFRQFAK